MKRVHFRAAVGLSIMVLGTPALVSAQPAPAPREAHNLTPATPALALLGVEMLLLHLGGEQPFARPLAVAQRLAQEDAEIAATLATLRDVAVRGAPTLATLAQGFAATADRAIAVDLGLGGTGAIGRFAAGTLRQGASLGAVMGVESPLFGATREAMARLAAGDLAGADAALASLHGAVADTFAPWREAALARIQADAAAARLASLVSARLGPTP